MDGLDCVNKWCKYKDGFYCMENCGSYVKEGTRFCELNRNKIRATHIMVFNPPSCKYIAFGTIEEVFENCSSFKDRKIRKAHYDIGGSSTFMVVLD